MNGDYLIELTLAVYRISDDWSGSNFLKPQIRNLANEILIDFILLSRSKEGSLDIGPVFFKKIQDIQDCFNQARGKKLIDRNQNGICHIHYHFHLLSYLTLKQEHWKTLSHPTHL